MPDRPLVLGIVGPTACGKTALSLALAREMPIQVVCMDSMQVYQGMDIGTAKPTKEERAQVPHHMLDIRPPEAEFSVAEYREEAAAAIDSILSRGAIPLLVGGTGLYLRALSLPLDLGGTPKDEAVRQRWQDYLDEKGKEALHDALRRVDPPTAQRLHVNDTRRVIRALEVHELTGKRFSDQQMPGYDEGPYRFLLFAPDWERKKLYQRINQRVDIMLKEGLVEELRGLMAGGLSPEAQSMQGLGYKELLPYLGGEMDLDTAADLIKRRTRQYAKRQLTWFRKDKRIHWLPPDEAEERILTITREAMG